MPQTIKWAKLVEQDRIKAPGIPWSPEEWEAIHAGMNTEDVRNGYLSIKELEADKKDPAKRLKTLLKRDVAKLARKMGIKFDEKTVTKNDLLVEIEQKEKRDGVSALDILDGKDKLAAKKEQPEDDKGKPEDDKGKDEDKQADKDKADATEQPEGNKETTEEDTGTKDKDKDKDKDKEDDKGKEDKKDKK